MTTTSNYWKDDSGTSLGDSNGRSPVVDAYHNHQLFTFSHCVHSSSSPISILISSVYSMDTRTSIQPHQLCTLVLGLGLATICRRLLRMTTNFLCSLPLLSRTSRLDMTMSVFLATRWWLWWLSLFVRVEELSPDDDGKAGSTRLSFTFVSTEFVADSFCIFPDNAARRRFSPARFSLRVTVCVRRSRPKYSSSAAVFSTPANAKWERG